MIIWLNGAFGAGKTTSARVLLPLLAQARIFDSESVGLMLRHVLASVPVRDFQDWRPWRHVVVETASQILDYVGGTLVIPQTVLVEQYWDEIEAGLRRVGRPVHHVVLHVDRETLIKRIDNDKNEAGARRWRLDHLPEYERALDWLRDRAEIIDTTLAAPAQVADQIGGSLRRRNAAV